MKDSERKNSLNLEKIEAMSQEIKDLQAKFQGERSNFELSRKEL
jgi:hypothetical protein